MGNVNGQLPDCNGRHLQGSTLLVERRNGRCSKGGHEPAAGEGEVEKGEAGTGVTHDGAQDQLQEDDRRGQGDPAPEYGHAGGEQRGIMRGDELPGGGIGQGDDHEEKCLGQGGVNDGHRRGQEQQDGDAAQRALQHDGAQGQPTQAAHPGPLLRPPQPQGQNHDQQAHQAGYHAMAVLVKYPAHHVDQRKGEHEPAIGGGPVGHGEARARAGDQAADEDERQRSTTREDGEPVERAVVSLQRPLGRSA